MKTLRLLFPVLLGFALVFTACKKEEAKESCDAEDYADDFQCPNPTVATFCIGTDANNPSYYAYNGTTYKCAGVEPNTCSVALAQMEEAMKAVGCSAKAGSIEVKLTAKAEELLVKFQSQSLY